MVITEYNDEVLLVGSNYYFLHALGVPTNGVDDPMNGVGDQMNWVGHPLNGVGDLMNGVGDLMNGVGDPTLDRDSWVENYWYGLTTLQARMSGVWCTDLQVVLDHIKQWFLTVLAILWQRPQMLHKYPCILPFLKYDYYFTSGSHNQNFLLGCVFIQVAHMIFTWLSKSIMIT